jgi:hypothetical protein
MAIAIGWAVKNSQKPQVFICFKLRYIVFDKDEGPKS